MRLKPVKYRLNVTEWIEGSQHNRRLLRSVQCNLIGVATAPKDVHHQTFSLLYYQPESHQVSRNTPMTERLDPKLFLGWVSLLMMDWIYFTLISLLNTLKQDKNTLLQSSLSSLLSSSSSSTITLPSPSSSFSCLSNSARACLAFQPKNPAWCGVGWIVELLDCLN